MPDIFTKREVVELLVQNNNAVMKMLGDNKLFVIEGDEVLCYRNRILGKKELSRYSFDYVIDQVRKAK